MIIKLFYITAVLVMLLIPTSSTQALDLDQSGSFTSEPSGVELTTNETLALTWGVSGSGQMTYEIFMTQDTEPEQIIAHGDVVDNSVTLELHKLVEGSYIFSFNLIAGSNSLWSNVTITVVTDPDSDNSDGSDGGFLPGFQFISLLGLVAIVILNKKRN